MLTGAPDTKLARPDIVFILAVYCLCAMCTSTSPSSPHRALQLITQSHPRRTRMASCPRGPAIRKSSVTWGQ